MATTTVKKGAKSTPTSKQALKTQAESLAFQLSESPIIVQKAFNRSVSSTLF